MSQQRYGFFIPPYGYVYDGAVWEEELKFTPDPTKAAINKSFVKQADAQSYLDAIIGRYPTAQLAKYVMKATADLIPNKSPEERQAELVAEYADRIALYSTLTAKYDLLETPSDWEAIDVTEWTQYTALKQRLALFGLLP